MPDNVTKSRPADNLDPFGFRIDPAYESWLDSLPADVDERDAWADEQDAAYLRELEAVERIGHNYDHPEA